MKRATLMGKAFTLCEQLLATTVPPRLVGRCGHLLLTVVLPPGPGHAAPEWKFLWQFQD